MPRELTATEAAVLNDYAQEGAEAWWANAHAQFPSDQAETLLAAKVAKHQAAYQARLAAGNYQTKAEREAAAAPSALEIWSREMKRLDARVQGDTRFWEEFAQGNVSAFAQARMDALIAEREAHRQARPV